MDEFENMILNVRNSFRLLYFFNRRILDLMKYIGNKLNIPFGGGYSMFSEPSPKNGKGHLDNWAWDWLNMYFYRFHFKKNKISFAIILQSDTGMWDANVGELDVDKFEKTSISKTKLIFVFNNNNNKDRDLTKVLESENLKGEYEKTFEIPLNKKNILYCMVFDIGEFRNKEATDNSLNKFIEYLNENNIDDLKIIDENIR
jgi:hypothetical protein